MHSPGWEGVKLRVMRQVRDSDEIAGAHDELRGICEAARIEADIVVPVSSAPFGAVLADYSADATLIMLGFIPPPPAAEAAFHEAMAAQLTDLPSTILVSSSGGADLQA
jgi:hypothetical protein